MEKPAIICLRRVLHLFSWNCTAFYYGSRGLPISLMTWSDFWQHSGISLRLLADFLPLLLALTTVALGYVNVFKKNINPKEVHSMSMWPTYSKVAWWRDFCSLIFVLNIWWNLPIFIWKVKFWRFFFLNSGTPGFSLELTQTPFGTVI